MSENDKLELVQINAQLLVINDLMLDLQERKNKLLKMKTDLTFSAPPQEAQNE